MTPKLIKLKIDKFQCKCLKSSLELTKIKIKADAKGSKTVHKDKSSESLPILLRPMFSTNFSDAFKYLVYRPAYVSLVNTHRDIQEWILVWVGRKIFVILKKNKLISEFLWEYGIGLK